MTAHCSGLAQQLQQKNVPRLGKNKGSSTNLLHLLDDHFDKHLDF
jgi:hypothetical protein